MRADGEHRAVRVFAVADLDGIGGGLPGFYAVTAVWIGIAALYPVTSQGHGTASLQELAGLADNGEGLDGGKGGSPQVMEHHGILADRGRIVLNQSTGGAISAGSGSGTDLEALADRLAQTAAGVPSLEESGRGLQL